MTDNRPFKIKANEDYTKELLSSGTIADPEKNYLNGRYGWTSFESAYVFDPDVKLAGFFFSRTCRVYLDEPLQNQEEEAVDLGNTNTSKFIIQAEPKHADDLISYGMTIPGEIFVYVPSPDKPIDDKNPLCFVSEDKASKFSSWPEGVSKTCFFPVYNWVSVQLPGIMACSEVVCTISQPPLDEPSGDKVHTQLPEQQFEREFVRRLYRVSAQYPTFGCAETTSDVTGCNDPSLDEPSLDSSKEINIKSLDKYAMQSLDKYLLDLQSDMLHLSEAIVAALECLRGPSDENSDSFVKAYNKYRSKRGQTVLGGE